MYRTPLILLAVLAAAMLAVSAAGAYPVGPGSLTPARFDATLLPPAPDAAGCPALPVSMAEIPDCPPDPVHPGGTRCNYDDGNPADPCPHATVNYIIVRCDGDGSVLTVARAATAGVDDAATSCDGSYVVLDDGTLPAGDPPAPPPACPDRPSSLDPLAICPFDPDTYPAWTGDDAHAPLWTRCNYDSGDAGNPCPHSTTTSDPFYIRCDGQVWSVTRYEDGVDIGKANAEQACPNGYVDLSLP